MSIEFTNDSPGVSDVPGFRVGAAGCDIRNKSTDRLDLTLVVADRPCAAAGVFTTNDVKAAPVRFCQQVLAVSADKIRGIVGNSGNANACTAAQGDADAAAMAKLSAAAVGAPDDAFLVCSTGRIGELLPMAKVAEGIKVSASRLTRDAAEGVRSANAILTSDTRPKSVTARFVWEGKTVTLAGIAKGAGMIEPNMATMLAFVCTDAAASPAELKAALKASSDQSFNCVSVDGDMSTNDTVLVLANGLSGNDRIKSTKHKDFAAFGMLDRPKHHVDTFLQGDVEAGHALISDRQHATALAVQEERNHGTTTPHDIAIAHYGKARLVAA